MISFWLSQNILYTERANGATIFLGYPVSDEFALNCRYQEQVPYKHMHLQAGKEVRQSGLM